MRSIGLSFCGGLPWVAVACLASCGVSSGGLQSGPSGNGASTGAAGANGSGSNASGGSGSGGGSGGVYPPGTGPAVPFPGGNGSGQQNLIGVGISPLSCGPSSSFNGTTVVVVGGDKLTCFFSAVVSPTLPLAFLEQDEETIGGKDLIHVRLTMNPTFVDNTYGTTAIGWAGPDAGGMGPGGAHGHTFWDLVDSDHAEFDFEDASGDIVLSFNLDYCSADTNSPSGYACLGVSGGDGGMLVGNASDVVYYNSSLARDLTSCGYSSYTTNSPATDADYTPNPAAPNWDYRVVYDVWVAKSALPSGWTVSIPYVHASPSKMSSTYTVKSAPCPPLGCVGERCQTGGGCVGAGCDGGSGGCVGEGCQDGGGSWDGATADGACVGEGCGGGSACVGLLCDSGSSTTCIGEGCSDGGSPGGSWCTPSYYVCTDDSACCSGACLEGLCR